MELPPQLQHISWHIDAASFTRCGRTSVISGLVPIIIDTVSGRNIVLKNGCREYIQPVKFRNTETKPPTLVNIHFTICRFICSLAAIDRDIVSDRLLNYRMAAINICNEP